MYSTLQRNAVLRSKRKLSRKRMGPLCIIGQKYCVVNLYIYNELCFIVLVVVNNKRANIFIGEQKFGGRLLYDNLL